MLGQFLVSELFAFMMVFTRMGSGIMMFPGFSEMYISMRIRLLFALSVSLIVTPLVAPLMPPVPASPAGLLLAILCEVLIGVIVGTIVRIFISIMHIAGMIVSTQIGVANAMMFDATQATQTTTLGNMLGVGAVVLLFATDTHHLMLQALYETYGLFPPGHIPMMEDSSMLMVTTLSRAFGIAVQISMPLIVTGIIIQLASGVLTRLMPTFQILAIMIGPQMLMNFFILSLTVPLMMWWFLEYVQGALGMFITP